MLLSGWVVRFTAQSNYSMYWAFVTNRTTSYSPKMHSFVVPMDSSNNNVHRMNVFRKKNKVVLKSKSLICSTIHMVHTLDQAHMHISAYIFKIKYNIFGRLLPNYFFTIIKINNFRGDLTDISAVTNTLTHVEQH